MKVSAYLFSPYSIKLKKSKINNQHYLGNLGEELRN